MFIFDENFSSLQGWGTSVNLLPWYGNADTVIRHASFVCGCEEILLVDSGADARIFSFTTQQFRLVFFFICDHRFSILDRPATLHLEQIPTAVYSAPDGSCILFAMANMDDIDFRAFHWTTFGASEGISLKLPQLPLDSVAITSMVNRSSVYLLYLDINIEKCISFALDITKKSTEFTFKEKGGITFRDDKKGETLHNSILDCHSEVWTRFPVLAAVRRQTFISSTRLGKNLLFVSESNHDAFRPYFSDMIQIFERRTKKPTGDELRTIQVDGISFEDLIAAIPDFGHTTSFLRAGEWLVELLCLIPIHIAITRENRFVPLKDGVSSAELERFLLGAEVNQIVDTLSFGWYESIFQSYQSKKVGTATSCFVDLTHSQPVRVVSSMGLFLLSL